MPYGKATTGSIRRREWMIQDEVAAKLVAIVLGWSNRVWRFRPVNTELGRDSSQKTEPRQLQIRLLPS